MTQRKKRLHKDVSLDEVIRLYREESWTAERIAKRHGISSTSTIFTWLREAGVERRIAARQHFNADSTHIKDLYHRQQLTLKEIGEEFGVDEMTVLLFSELPGVRLLIENAFRPVTYYTINSLEAFQHVVHDSILHVMDELARHDDVALLPEENRRVIWEELW
jgi:hypothetical protein